MGVAVKESETMAVDIPVKVKKVKSSKRHADETAEERKERRRAKKARKELKQSKDASVKLSVVAAITAMDDDSEGAAAVDATEPAATADVAELGKAWLAKHEVKIHSSTAPPPCMSLEDAPFPAKLVSKLQQQGFSEPAPVQAASWPLGVAGNDVLSIAKTGSGKTLGFLLPAIALAAQNKSRDPCVVIMAPTRELAMQIQSEAMKFGTALGVRSVCLYGGAPKGGQLRQLRQGANLLVCTPGRLMDFLDMHGGGRGPATNVNKVKLLVLDEADRMLDMGFEKDIQALASAMPVKTMLFTATWPTAVRKIAAKLLNPESMVKVTVGTGGEKLTANKSVKQTIRVVRQADKWQNFVEVVKPLLDKDRSIIFCNTKRQTQKIADHFWEAGHAIDYVSGDRTQQEREKVIRQFKLGRITTLVGTDVAARGLDIDGVEHVINYDFPRDSAEDYVHRIGRTGRAGKTGESHTFFTSNDLRHGRELIRILKDAEQEVPPALESLVRSAPAKKKNNNKWRFGGRRRW